MEEQIKILIQESTTAAPGRLSEILVDLSSISAYLSEQLDNILIFKADQWLTIRKDVKSDRMADRVWDSIPEGKLEIKLRGQIKRIEKVMSAIKLRLKIKEGESFGRF